jgi:AraC-like DNA-binding protein
MRRGQDIATRFAGLFLIHHNKPAYRVAAHAHDEHHLFLPLRGEVTVHLGDQTLVAGPGRMIYVPAATEHSFEAPNEKEGERLICLIDGKLWRRQASYHGPARIAPVHQLAKEILFYLLLRPDTRAASTLVTTLLETVAESLTVAVSDGDPAHLSSQARDPRLRKAVVEIESRFRDDLRVDEVARRAGLSGRSLTRLCSQELGCGPKDLITRYRVTEARRLLEQGQSVTETAFEVGYGSLSRFIEAFRSLTGLLPSDVRA